MSSIANAAAERSAVGGMLHDTTGIDYMISAAFLATLLAVIAALLAARTSGQSILRWSIVALVVAGLLVNQQLDLQTPLLESAGFGDGASGLNAFGTQLTSYDAAAIVVALTIMLSAAILTASSRNGFLGPWAGAGLILLVVHGSGRAVTFLHVLDGGLATGRVPNTLRAIEAAGLLCIAVGAILSRRRRGDRRVTAGSAVAATRSPESAGTPA